MFAAVCTALVVVSAVSRISMLISIAPNFFVNMISTVRAFGYIFILFLIFLFCGVFVDVVVCWCTIGVCDW